MKLLEMIACTLPQQSQDNAHRLFITYELEINHFDRSKRNIFHRQNTRDKKGGDDENSRENSTYHNEFGWVECLVAAYDALTFLLFTDVVQRFVCKVCLHCALHASRIVGQPV